MARMFTGYIVVAVFDNQERVYFGPFFTEERAREYAGSSDNIVDYCVQPLVIPHHVKLNVEV
jgi:hypothetical protein